MELSFEVVAEKTYDLMRYHKLWQKDYKNNEKQQAEYLRKRARGMPFYRRLDEKEQDKFEKQIITIVHTYVEDEEITEFTLSQFYGWLLRILGKHQLLDYETKV